MAKKSIDVDFTLSFYKEVTHTFKIVSEVKIKLDVLPYTYT